MGTLVLGFVVAATGSSRLAIMNLVIFFIAGLAIVLAIQLSPPTASDSESLERPRECGRVEEASHT